MDRKTDVRIWMDTMFENNDHLYSQGLVGQNLLHRLQYQMLIILSIFGYGTGERTVIRKLRNKTRITSEKMLNLPKTYTTPTETINYFIYSVLERSILSHFEYKLVVGVPTENWFRCQLCRFSFAKKSPYLIISSVDFQILRKYLCSSRHSVHNR